MKKRIIAIIATMALLTGCNAATTTTTPKTEATSTTQATTKAPETTKATTKATTTAATTTKAAEGKTVKKTYEGSFSPNVHTKVYLDAKGDTVVKQKIVNTMIFSELGLTSEAEIKEFVEKIKASEATSYPGVKGVTYKITSDAKSITETIDIDYTQADLKQLSEVDLIGKEGIETAKFISLAKTEENLKAQGLKLVP